MKMNKQFLKVLFVSHGTVIKDCGYKARVLSEIEAIAGKKTSMRIIRPVLLSFEKREEYLKEQKLHTINRLLRLWGGRSYFFNRVPFSQKGYLLGAAFMIWESILIIIIALKERVKIVHAESLSSAIRCLLITKLIGIPMIFDVHGLQVEERQYMSKGDHSAKDKVLKYLERSCLRYSDLGIVVSAAMKDYLEEIIKMKKVAVMPCCVNTNLFKYDRNIRLGIRERLGISYSFVVLYSGSFFDKWQQAKAMTKIFKEIESRISNSLFFILSPDKEENVASYLTKQGLKKGTFRIKRLNHRDVPRYLIAGDIGLIIRKKHIINQVASPTKFGEYMACGVPVLCTDGIGDISSIVRRYNVGCILNEPIENEDWDAVCRKLLRIANEDARQKCLQVALQHFNWKRYSCELADIYSGLTS